MSKMEYPASYSTARELWDLKDGEQKIPIWVDCDTGHDDAFAILLAAHCPKLELLGVSTVHGNSSLTNTTRNTLSILEAIGKRNIDVFPGAEKPFCRDAAHAPDIHGESGLDGTTILPAPVKVAKYTGTNESVQAMYQALSSTVRGTAWLVSTGALTNIALLFAIHPALADHIAGLSVMGGAIGGFFTHAPIGRLRHRVPLSKSLSRKFPGGLPDDSNLSISDVARRFKSLGLIQDGSDIDDKRIELLLQESRRSFGNTTDYAEFNIFCDPEAASSIFSNKRLAAKTTLIPLDVTHQVLGNREVIKILSNNYSGPANKLAESAVRHLFLEIMMFFASTYEREFAMSEGPPLHDPIAVAAAFAPQMFDDNDGERFEVFVVKSGGETPFQSGRNTENVGQCGRTIARMVRKGESGVRIPRSLRVGDFWAMIELALREADKLSPLTFNSLA
ncbi:uncharacterized protein PV09_07376 [Verruconis gallopava]|uniref:Inosine/uridine-preferring nucleoside hydrolase domain-containing protein n=1 Tax=Verruconis gallopava TaxID=253628 RepID=A0A0D2APK7_9PEZI|nr:uncharacterized protein PV09_07376 [Verruconis gallopava]KIW01089.1 hypothetical protein PV09_07376 [Verruconis gallopava]